MSSSDCTRRVRLSQFEAYWRTVTAKRIEGASERGEEATSDGGKREGEMAHNNERENAHQQVRCTEAVARHRGQTKIRRRWIAAAAQHTMSQGSDADAHER